MSWTTGPTSITSVTTTTPLGNQNILNTVFITGSNNFVPGATTGTITLVTPTRVLTSQAGNLPVLTTLTLRFTPEPGAALMLVSAVAGLAVLGYRRKRQ